MNLQRLDGKSSKIYSASAYLAVQHPFLGLHKDEINRPSATKLSSLETSC